ncbi:MAG: GHMP kinase [Parcubacteria group bacterium]|nr:GHMP kinase [Parcubacteria group bacterium]
MIITRSPLRISFVGGGTDLPAFYRTYPGRVISTTINKYVYAVIHPTPLLNKFLLRYSITESASHPRDLKHPSIKAALLDLGITDPGIEIGSFADLPSKTGLGSSSSFSAALLKGLNIHLGRKLSAEEVACGACRLEIDLLKEPIGKQDQYAASYGGLNLIQFNEDDSVNVKPLFLDFKKRSALEDHVLLFFTGITRSASDVLKTQSADVDKHFDTYRKMSDSVFDFERLLIAGDMKGMGEMLHDGWLLKKTLANNISNTAIDTLYEAGRSAGAWGGKVLGAGGGGCVLFLADPQKHDVIRKMVTEAALGSALSDFREIPVKFVQSGTDVLFNYQQQ